MEYLKNGEYRRDVETAVRHTVGFDYFRKKKILITGAGGLIGSFLVDCFLYADETLDAGIVIYALGRSRRRLKERFGNEREGCLQFLEADVTRLKCGQSFDCIIHAAGYGHPRAFREMPAEVLWSNVAGTRQVLELAGQKAGCRVLYVSSGEVQERMEHITARACYPVGKLAAETLCISYIQEYGCDVVIARPCHTFGANVTKEDNRAATQFLTSAMQGVDIEMYSRGEQVRTFIYVADCVSGLLSVLSHGGCGEVYNVSAGESCSLRAFAEGCGAAGKCRVKVHAPTEQEKAEASPIAEQIVKNDALRKLGWSPAFSIAEGIQRSIRIMRGMNGE